MLSPEESWKEKYKKWDEELKGVSYRTFKFSVETPEVIDTDYDFAFKEFDIDFKEMQSILKHDKFLEKYYDILGTRGLELGMPYYANKAEFKNHFTLVETGDEDYIIPKFEVLYKMYESNNVQTDLRPILEFAQFVCWLLIRSIRGRYFDIESYIWFMADMIKEFDCFKFCYKDLLGHNRFRDFHKIEREFEFCGNASGTIRIKLEEVQ